MTYLRRSVARYVEGDEDNAEEEAGEELSVLFPPWVPDSWVQVCVCVCVCGCVWVGVLCVLCV